MNKRKTACEALKVIKDGDAVMVGGFLQGGSPEYLLAHLAGHPARGLTIINNDCGRVNTWLNKLMQVNKGLITRFIASFAAQNPSAQELLMENPEAIEFVPQGTLAERIRAAGAGIPAFYTATGAGTVVAKGKESRVFEGREYLMERALRGNVALIHATVADELGNCFMRGSTKNFNAIMPAAADYTIVEAEKIVPVGELGPEDITVPGIFVNAIVQIESSDENSTGEEE